tara:strand:+ start:350 stop:571 length:222 start_codon:yes stop_codon:yes gene_type:complete
MGNDVLETDRNEIMMKDSAKTIGVLLLLLCALSSTGHAQVLEGIDLNDGLIGYYPLNGTTLDRSGVVSCNRGC